MYVESPTGYIILIVLMIVGLIWAIRKSKKEKEEIELEDDLFWIHKEYEDAKKKKNKETTLNR